MHLLSALLRPRRVAEAHCDGPCGIYDPASARIAAEAVLSMAQKIVALGDADDAATNNTRSRFTAIKEEQSELAKRELNILWTDYFNPERTAGDPGPLADVLERRQALLPQQDGTERRGR